MTASRKEVGFFSFYSLNCIMPPSVVSDLSGANLFESISARFTMYLQVNITQNKLCNKPFASKHFWGLFCRVTDKLGAGKNTLRLF